MLQIEKFDFSGNLFWGNAILVGNNKHTILLVYCILLSYPILILYCIFVSDDDNLFYVFGIR